MLSNLHSFHFGALLQNSSALPWHVYHSTTNKLLLSPLKSATTTAATSIAPAITMKSWSLKKRAAYLSKNLTKKRQAIEPNKAITAPKPVSQNPKTKSIPSSITQQNKKPDSSTDYSGRQNHAAPQPSGKTIQKWKRGPGVIEKVDKATGEIMHLSKKPTQQRQNAESRKAITAPKLVRQSPKTKITPPPTTPKNKKTDSPMCYPGKRNHTAPQLLGKAVPKWKPGPGVIEKVNKATGEIMHLSAE